MNPQVLSRIWDLVVLNPGRDNGVDDYTDTFTPIGTRAKDRNVHQDSIVYWHQR